MAKHPWLTQREGVFYVRARVPKDIVERLGKREIVYSLKTTDPKVARQLIATEAKSIADRFAAARHSSGASQAPASAEADPQQQPLPAAQIQRWCDDHFQRLVDQDFEYRSELYKKVAADPLGFHEDKYIEHPTSDWYHTFYEELSLDERLLCCVENRHKQLLRATRRDLALGDIGKRETVADDILISANLAVGPNDRLRLVRRLLETDVTAYEAMISKDSSRYEEISRRYCPTTASATSPNVTPGPLLQSLIETFLSEGQRSGLVKKTTLSDKTDLREFVEIVGNKQIRNYTAADGTLFKDTLLAVPSQRKVAPFKGLNIAQAAKEAEKRDPQRKVIPRLHVDTINDKLMVVRKFFRWADGREKNVQNPIEGLRIKPTRKRGKKTKTRYPFTTEELQKLFDGPIYTGCKNLNRWRIPGTVIPRQSAQFWVPLIGLFTGMRLGEIMQLRVSDLKTVDRISYFDIATAMEVADDDGAKSTKNENSIRKVPVHRMLFDIGFGDFLKVRQASTSTRLFPGFGKSPSDDSWSKTFSAWFTRYRREMGVERIIAGKNRVDFHSFRHVFEDVVRDLPDVKKEWRDALQGHGEGGSSENYGLGVRLQRLNEAMQKVKFAGLDLSHLRQSAP